MHRYLTDKGVSQEKKMYSWFWAVSLRAPIIATSSPRSSESEFCASASTSPSSSSSSETSQRWGISGKGDVVLVLGNIVNTSSHGDILTEVIRVEVLRIRTNIVSILVELRVFADARLLALFMCVANVLKLAFWVSAITFLGEVGTLVHMLLVTIDTFFAVTKKSKGMANKGAS